MTYQHTVPFDIRIRAATREDILKFWTADEAPVTPGESAVIEFPEGNPIAFTDEYGTATLTPDQIVSRGLIEKLVKVAIDVYSDSLE